MKQNKIFIIAEAGVNHNGNVKIAKKMVDAAKHAGADAIKFQTFRAEKLASRYAPKAGYQQRMTGMRGSQLDMLKKLELAADVHKKLIDYCKKKGIIFISSPFDAESIELLHKLGLRILKIPSGEITNYPYLRKIGSLGKKIIMSTGMADLKETRKALLILTGSGTPKRNITILHCNSAYPTRFEDANLKAMNTIKNALKINVGYSDHTTGIELPVAAVALGATVIEKHFTLDKNMRGPDHKISLEPKELEEMVRAIRNVEKSFGSGLKSPSLSELKNRKFARKSIVASREIRKGEHFSENNITTKRPADGLNPMKWGLVIGKRAKKNFTEGEPIYL